MSHNIENHMGSYKRVMNNNGCGFRGFKLNMRKLSIQRIRVKFLSLFRRSKKTYERAVRCLRLRRSSRCHKKMKKSNNKINSCNYWWIGGGGERKSMEYASCRLRPLSRTNSFYSEAIADCLEFIKRNSLSLDDPHHHDEAAPIVAAIR